ALGIPGATRVPMPKERAKAWLGALIRDRGGLNVSTIDSLLYLLLSMNALAEGLPPDFTPAFTSEEVVLPFLEEILNEAWQGDEALTSLVKRAWKAVVDNSDFAGFIASDGLAKRLVELMPLVVQGRLEGLAPAETLQQELLPSLREGLHQACRTLLAGDGQDFTLHATFRKLLARLAGTADEAMEREAGRETAQGAGYASFRYQPADFRSAFLAKDSLAQACTKKSQPPDEACACYQRLKLTARDLAALEAMAAQAAACQPLAEFARLVDQRCRDRRLESGLVPSDAIPPLVERLLHEGCAEAMCRFGTTLRHILVDEFQDTSRAQWRAMAPLVEEAVSSKQDGSFTWVGDVKQAIYGFRGGDSLLFDELAETGAIPASRETKREKLPRNWRSRREIIAFNNTLFAPLDPAARLDALLAARGAAPAGPELGRLSLQAWEQASGFAEELLKAPFTDAKGACSLKDEFTCGQALDRLPGAPPEEGMTAWFARKLAQAYRDARQEPSPRSGDGGRVVVVDFPESGEEDDAPGQEEGVRRCIGAGRAQGRPWSDFLVLVRRNQDANALARHLSQADIPVITDNSLLLAQHPLVVQSVALLAFLLAPDDDIAFWTLASGSILAGTEAGTGAGEAAGACPANDGADAARPEPASPAQADKGSDTAAEAEAGTDPDYLLSGEAADAASLRQAGPRLPSAFRQRQDEDLLRLSSAKAGQRDARPLWKVWAEAHPACFREHLAPLMQGMASMTPYDAVFEWYRRERVFERFPEAAPFLKRFLELLYACRSKGLRSLAEVLAWWQEHSEEEKVPLPGGMDAVQVMTVHKAKGLERPVVIVPWTSRRASGRAALDVVDYQLATDPGTIVRSLCRPDAGLFPQAQAKRLREAFESVNGLYVAFTRAREELYIFTSTSKPEGAGRTLDLLLQQAGALVPAALSLDEAFPPEDFQGED
ncbi:MAG: UvrD-helicase domain-containing protein, partial [Desulfovibrio sp.]|nr:UvrD-helicase domain-containing protein [Desulfovibrio sp.]